MLKTIPASFSDKKLLFTIPDAWIKLSQQQLRYVCYALLNFEGQSAKIYIFVRLMGIEVLKQDDEGWLCRTKIASGDRISFHLPTWKIQSYLHVIDFIDTPSTTPVCLMHIGKLSCIDPLFHNIKFNEYLQIENLYQGYLVTKDDGMLISMGKRMYVDDKKKHPENLRFKKEELLSIFLWYSSVKMRFALEFPDFFNRVDSSDEVDTPKMMDIMNSEIRALTGGDITKENTVLEMDCWRALTELNEKAREAKEFNDKYGHK